MRSGGKVKLATGISLALNAVLVITGQYRASYDAYGHMFFADHYVRDWWSLWEERWYTGFPVVSYPPLVHQVMALFARITGVEFAFGLVLLLVLTALPGAVYGFTRLFTSREAAGIAACIAALLPSVTLSAYTFGQLPTLAGLLLALYGFQVFGGYLKNGRLIDLALGVALTGTLAAAHHGTLLLLPWGWAAVGAHLLLTRKLSWRRLLSRAVLFSLAAGIAILGVIWPFWQWGLDQEMQVPIDHLSRHNFLLDPAARLFFFYPVYGALLLAVPWVLLRAFRRPGWRRRVSLAFFFMVLFILGLGGTTPLPAWLFGAGWEWLTYDRFALWATIALLPGAAEAVLWIKWRLTRGYFAGHDLMKLFWSRFPRVVKGRVLEQRSRFPRTTTWTFVRAAGAGFLLLFALASALWSKILPTQPPPISMGPVVSFLAEGNRSEWRYLTFGFGSQMARLSLLTGATTMDGSYFTARLLPELRVSGLGEIDSAVWLPGGMAALDRVLDFTARRGVRWGFVARGEYGPLLAAHGWTWVMRLSNGVSVWENPAALAWRDKFDPPPAGIFRAASLATASTLRKAGPSSASGFLASLVNFINRFICKQPQVITTCSSLSLQSLSWGTLPPGMLLLATGLGIWRKHPPRRLPVGNQHLLAGIGPDTPLIGIASRRRLAVVLRGVHLFSLGLLPLGLSLWFFQPLSVGIQPRVYFTYQSVLFYLSDGFVLLAVGAWALAWLLEPHPFLERLPQPLTGLLLSWISLGLASAAWSSDPLLSVYTAAHLGWLFILYVTLVDTPQGWQAVQAGAILALVVQLAAGGYGFLRQSTSFLDPLGLKWPGDLDASMREASVVQLLDGQRWLRMYGTLPHPNLLGGMLMAWLAAPVAIFLKGGRWKVWALLLVGLGLAGLGLTFSRSAWLGCLAGAAFLGLKRANLPRPRLLALAACAVIILLALWIPLRAQFAARTTNLPVKTETDSTIGRMWMSSEALKIIQAHPWNGVGLGSYTLVLSRELPGTFKVEPVHNVVLLAAAELGLPGALIFLACGAAVLAEVRRKTGSVDGIVLSALLVGLLVIGMLDHYSWTMAPGRVFAWLVLGVWAGSLTAWRSSSKNTSTDRW